MRARLPLPPRVDGLRCLHVREGEAGALAGSARYDLVVLWSVLRTLRDPVLALQRAAERTRGAVVVVEGIDLLATLRWPRTPVARLDGRDGTWWHPNRAALLGMVQSAGLTIDEVTRVISRGGRAHVALRARARPDGEVASPAGAAPALRSS